MGKSKDLATGAAYQDQTESDTRYVNASGDTMTGKLALTQANSNTPPFVIEAATEPNDFSVSGYSDANGAYYMLGANMYLNSGGNTATWESSENSAGILLDSRGTNGVEFSTGTGTGTVNLKVDGSGRVTKPNQPAFMVVMTSAPTVTGTSNSTLPWNSEIFDVGSNFNTSNYRFTAPVAGKYYMHLHLELHSDSSWTTSTWTYVGDFWINGTQKTGADYWGHSSKYNLITNAVILDLNANDYVDVRARANNNTLRYSGDSAGAYFNCRWFGYLIG